MEIVPDDVNLIIGPNNSGKSLFLREVDSYCKGASIENFKIIDNIVLERYERDEIDNLLERFKRTNGEKTFYEKTRVPGSGQTVFSDSVDSLYQWQNYPASYKHFLERFIHYFVYRLNGAERFNLVQPESYNNLIHEQSNGILGNLFYNDENRAIWKKHIHKSFGIFPLISLMESGKFSIYYSYEEPSNLVEQGTHKDARTFYKNKCIAIDQVSDGVKSFTGILAAFLSIKNSVILLDEPEAFLHPQLCYLLATACMEIAGVSGSKLFIATHSSNFLQGIAESKKNNSILKFDRQNDSFTVKRFTNHDIFGLNAKPSIRNTGILDSFFYNNVVIVEGDTDRLVYQEVLNFLIEIGKIKSINISIKFLNAMLKDNIPQIINYLKNFGIKVCVIADFDILENRNFKSYLKISNASDSIIDSIARLKGRLMEGTEGSRISPKLLDTRDPMGIQKLINDCKGQGLFIVPVGALENRVNYMKIPNENKNHFAIKFLDSYKDEKNHDFDKDIWLFIKQVIEFLNSR